MLSASVEAEVINTFSESLLVMRDIKFNLVRSRPFELCARLFCGIKEPFKNILYVVGCCNPIREGQIIYGFTLRCRNGQRSTLIELRSLQRSALLPSPLL